MYHNIVIGTPLVEPSHLISTSEEEWEKFDRRDTLFTNEKYLPAALVEAGVAKSRSEVRKNRPDLNINLDQYDCIDLKWGKNHICVVIGIAPNPFLDINMQV